MDFTVNDFLQYFSVLTSFIGYYFITKKSIKGFYWWFFANIFSVIYFIKIKSFGFVILNVFYTIMTTYSIYNWKKLEQINKKKSNS